MTLALVPFTKGQDDDLKKKYPDELLAPFVKECFNFFATGNYSIRSLCDYMRQKGMTNKAGENSEKGFLKGCYGKPTIMD